MLTREGAEGLRLAVPGPCGSCRACARRAADRVATIPVDRSARFSGRIGDTVVLSVSATGLLNCAALLFLPAILAVGAVALASSILASTTTLVAALLLPALTLALVLGRWAAARAGTSLLRLELETPAAVEASAAGAGGRVVLNPAESETQDSQEQFR